MEHPGAIFYNASGLMLDESATQNQQLERASVISHETAHMWFGDLVTMRWFTDVWMKEVFANFMAAKIVNPSFPAINHDLRFLFAYYPAAYDVDRTEGTNPIRQPLANLNEAGTLYGNIIYDKAPIVMRQLEVARRRGFRFATGCATTCAAFSFGNASWSELDQPARRPDAGRSRDVESCLGGRGGRPVITTAADDRQRTHRAADIRAARSLSASRAALESEVCRSRSVIADRVELLPVHLVDASVEVTGARGLRRRCSSCRTAEASPTASSISIPRASRG